MPDKGYIPRKRYPTAGSTSGLDRDVARIVDRILAQQATDEQFNYEAIENNALWRYDVNAKGDLLVGTAADRVSRLGVGTNNHVLTADSAAAAGVAWKTIPVQAQTEHAIFSHAGVPTTDTSPRWYPRSSGSLFQILASLGTAGNANTNITVYKNDVSIATFTFVSGETYRLIAVSPSVAFAANADDLRVKVTTVGNLARDLTVQARFQ